MLVLKLSDIQNYFKLFELLQQELGPQGILNLLEQQFVDLQAIHADLQIEAQNLGLSQVNDLPMVRENEGCLKDADSSLQASSLHNTSERSIHERNMDRSLQDSNMDKSLQDSNMDKSLQDSHMDKSLQDSNMDRSLQDSKYDGNLEDSNMDRNIQDSLMDRNLEHSHLNDDNMDRNYQEMCDGGQVNGNYMSYEYNMNVEDGFNNNNNTEFYNQNQEVGADGDAEDVMYEEEDGVENDDHGGMEDYSRIEDDGGMEQYYAAEAGKNSLYI